MGPVSGADETIVTYATRLRSANHDSTVLLMYPHAIDDPYYLRLENAGVPVHAIASAGTRASLSTGRKLAASLLTAFPPSQRLVRRQAQRISTRIAVIISRNV